MFPVRHFQHDYEVAFAATTEEFTSGLAAMLPNSPNSNDVAVSHYHGEIEQLREAGLQKRLSRFAIGGAERKNTLPLAKNQDELLSRLSADTIRFQYEDTARAMAYSTQNDTSTWPLGKTNRRRSVVIAPVFNPIEALLHARDALSDQEVERLHTTGVLLRDIELVDVAKGLATSQDILYDAMKLAGFETDKRELPGPLSHPTEMREDYTEGAVGSFLLQAAGV